METAPQPKEFIYYISDVKFDTVMVIENGRFVERTPKPDEFQVLEEGYFEALPIIKKTPKKIYFKYYGDGFTLDRQKMERDGYVWHFRLQTRFYDEAGKAQFEKEQAEFNTPIFLEKFGLSVADTETDLKKAYRTLSKQIHPDGGGTHDAFIELKKDYEQSLSFLQAFRAA